MIWLTWRQFRGQALIAFAALAALTAYLVFLGLRIRDTYDANVNCGAGCSLSNARQALENAYFGQLLLSGFLVVAVPALVGAFWGAPLIAREIETGTHRLVWNQSVTRVRWLSVKLGFVTLAGVALTGAFSALLTWAASPYDKVAGRFDPLVFPTRNIVPLGYAAFAIVAGITIGLLLRRTVPAMAVTLAIFAALQILLPTTIRPHLQTPITESVAFTSETEVQQFQAGQNDNSGVRVDGYASSMPGAWILSGATPLLNEGGEAVTRTQLSECFEGGGPGKAIACLAKENLHFTITYQPADRYWTFQWLEFAVYLLLAGLLAGFVFWRIPRGVS